MVHVLARLATQLGGWVAGWVAPNDRGPGFALERQMMMRMLISREWILVYGTGSILVYGGTVP
jgi:hypothetical protein